MKNNEDPFKQELAQKISEIILEKEQTAANKINAIFQSRRGFRNTILIIVFILFLILNLFSFKYL